MGTRLPVREHGRRRAHAGRGVDNVDLAGGTTPNPTYHNPGDHTETLQIDYDPAVISYADLLEVFWSSHSPTRPARKRQYMAAVFYHDEAQKKLALETRDRVAGELNAKIHTEILPLTEFYLAEDYHQKYFLQQEESLMREFEAMYPGVAGFVDSTAAARMNGFVHGHGSVELLRAELDDYGLSEAGRIRWLGIAESPNS